MTTFAPVRDAYQAWPRTADQLTFDGALEDSRRDEAAPAVFPSSANPTGILESIAVSASQDRLLEPQSGSHPTGRRGASNSRTPTTNGTRRKPSRASAAGATGGHCK